MGPERGPAPRPEDLAILYDTIRDLTSTLSLERVMRRLLRRVLVHLDSEIASVLLLGHDRKLRIRHAHGLPSSVVDGTCVGLGDGISGYVAREGRPLLVEDVEADHRFRRRNHERYYTHSAICAPLVGHGDVMGVINVNNKTSREPYTQADLCLVEAIAGHAAVALMNARRYEETLARAQHDALTGLANHGHFWSTLAVELERAARYERELSLVLLDIDHFKAFNDRYGHRGGDEALAGVARLLSDASRVHDFAARYGGEEFAVVLPETGRSGAEGYAEKLRQAVAATGFHESAQAELTVSAGIAAFPEDGVSPEGLVEAADARLYRAKAGGRNRVCARG